MCPPRYKAAPPEWCRSRSITSRCLPSLIPGRRRKWNTLVGDRINHLGRGWPGHVVVDDSMGPSRVAPDAPPNISKRSRSPPIQYPIPAGISTARLGGGAARPRAGTERELRGHGIGWPPTSPARRVDPGPRGRPSGRPRRRRALPPTRAGRVRRGGTGLRTKHRPAFSIHSTTGPVGIACARSTASRCMSVSTHCGPIR